MKGLKNKDCDMKQKIIKYLLIGILVSLSVRYIPKYKLDTNEILMIGSVASISFALIDMASPSIIVQDN